MKLTDKQIKLIYEYMGIPNLTVHEHFPLDSNSAWEVVQEMERQGDWKNFYIVAENIWLDNLIQSFDEMNNSSFIKWLYNPDNFFKCFGAWLEHEEGK